MLIVDSTNVITLNTRNVIGILLVALFMGALIFSNAINFDNNAMPITQTIELDRASPIKTHDLDNISLEKDVLSVSVAGADPYMSFALDSSLSEQYLRAHLPADHDLTSITVFYGFVETPYSQQASFTRVIEPTNRVVEFPLPNGDYRGLRIDFNGTIAKQRLKFGKLIVAPADETHSMADATKIKPEHQTSVTPILDVQPEDSFWMENSGNSVILNPRFVGENGIDVSDYNQLLSSLYNALPANERNREGLLLAAWRYLGDKIQHHCSPGRKEYWIIDPLELIAGYGYGCCTHTNRAFTKLAEHLGFETRFVSTYYHEYPEVKTSRGWQLLDANRGIRWFDEKQESPLIGMGTEHNLHAVNKVAKAWVETTDGERSLLSGVELANHARDLSERFAYTLDYNVTEVNPHRHFKFYPGDRLVFEPSTPITPLTHQAVPWNPRHSAKVTLSTTIDASRSEASLTKNGFIETLNMVLPFPVVSLKISGVSGGLIVNGIRLEGQARDSIQLTPEDLTDIKLDRNLKIQPSEEITALSMEVSMQFNPKLFDITVFENDGRVESMQARKVAYRDDSGNCRRQMTIGSGEINHKVNRGRNDCAQHTGASTLSKNLRSFWLWNNLRHIQNCKLDNEGIKTINEQACQAIFSIDKGSHQSATIKIDRSEFAQWHIKTESGWKALSPKEFGRYTWLLIDEMPVDKRNFILRMTTKNNRQHDSLVLSGLSYEVGAQSLLPSFLGDN